MDLNRLCPKNLEVILFLSGFGYELILEHRVF